MGNDVKKTEHSGAKKGTGAFWGRKRDAKPQSNKVRRERGKLLSREVENENQSLLLVHEALDRASIQLQSLELALGDHPVILEDEKSKHLYESAVQSLAELYQHLGNVSVRDA